jgi:tripartite-type tricarboxylate transporter receptor subunit TctC
MAAAPYRAKPIKTVIPFPVGSGTDAPAVETAWSQPE